MRSVSFCAFTFFLCVLLAVAAQSATSESVHPGPDGKLVYKTTPAGDRIMDFSAAGYMGGGVALPDVSTAVRVQPIGGGKDDTAAIQAAIDRVATMPLKDGFRGAVELAPGSYTCGSALNLTTSGI